MKRKSLAAFGIVFMLAVSGCGAQKAEEADEKAEQEQSSSDTKVSAEDMFTDRDLNTDYDESESAKIQLNGDSAECSSDAVSIEGSTITIKDEGTYIISGTLYDGMIIVNADGKDKPQLVFDGVTINSETSAPLYILEADKVVVTLAENSKNILSNGGTFTSIDENNIDAVIFSKQDLSLNGNRSLAVTSPAGHGIVSKDDLALTSGIYYIESAFYGMDANDSVRVTNAFLTVDAGKDGINAAGGTDESGFGGQRGNDQFGGPGGMGAGGGAASNGSIVISGGTFIGTGASMMAQTFRESKQGVIAVSVGSQSAGTSITLTDKVGNVVLTEEPQLDFQIAILSSPDIIKGETYTITVGSASGEFEAN